ALQRRSALAGLTLLASLIVVSFNNLTQQPLEALLYFDERDDHHERADREAPAGARRVDDVPAQAPRLRGQGPVARGLRRPGPTPVPPRDPARARRGLARDAGVDRRRARLRPRTAGGAARRARGTRASRAQARPERPPPTVGQPHRRR